MNECMVDTTRLLSSAILDIINILIRRSGWITNIDSQLGLLYSIEKDAWRQEKGSMGLHKGLRFKEHGITRNTRYCGRPSTGIIDLSGLMSGSCSRLDILY